VAALEFIHEVAEWTPRLEILDMRGGVRRAFGNLLEEIEPETAKHLGRPDAGDGFVVLRQPGKAQLRVGLPDPVGAGRDQFQKFVLRKVARRAWRRSLATRAALSHCALDIRHVGPAPDR